MLKVCGITTLVDAQHAVAQGATALGFVFWSRSPRSVAPADAASIIAGLPPGTVTVGVFVNAAVETIRQIVRETGISMVQLHGDEPPAYAEQLAYPLLRSAMLADVEQVRRAWPARTTLLLDAADPVRRGGTGTTVDWARAAGAARGGRVILAGGLTPENVHEAIATTRPYGVDVSSGVERSPGVKDREKVALFLSRARQALAEIALTEMRRS